MFLKAKKSQKIKQISSFRYVFIVSFKANQMLKYKSIILVVSVHPIVDSATNQTGKYFVMLESFNTKISHQLFEYTVTITFVNSQH